MNLRRATKRLLRNGLHVAAAALVVVAVAHSAAAQAKWEFTPYSVAVWIAAADPGQLNAASQQRLHSELAAAAPANFGAALTLTVEPPPAALAGAMVTRLESLTADEILAGSEAAFDFDKVMLVRIANSQHRWNVTVRELDVPTYQISPTHSRAAMLRAQLAPAVAQAIADAFTPIVLLKKIDGQTARGRLRAGRLAVDESSPARVDQQAALIPVIRHNDRLGKAAPADVRAVDWTVLAVQQADSGNVECRIHSAQRNPLASRARLRLVRYALAVKPPRQETQIVLQSSGSANSPLVDYEIVESDAATGDTQSLGRTDANGRLNVAWSDKPWRLLFVRHGDQALARLPMIPGWQNRITLPLASDDVRLAAAGLMDGIKQEVIDTVAQRQIVAARFRHRMAQGEFDRAEELIAEFRQLADQQDFERRLEEARSELVADNARTQQHIDNLLAETRSALRRYLDPRELQRMELQLAQARQGS